MASPLWDWSVFEPVAATYGAKMVRLSGESLSLFLSTEELTEIDLWTDGGEEPDFTTRDTIEALVAKAFNELMTNAMIGTIQPVATDAMPSGMLECDGTTYNRVDYPDLYAALASPFIVDADHFVTPDLRGRVVLGAGAGAGLSTYAAGDTGGEEAHQLTTAELASHAHSVNDLGHVHTEVTAVPTVITIGAGAPAPSAVPGVGVTGNTTTGISLNNSGSDTAHENRQPFMALRYGIWAI